MGHPTPLGAIGRGLMAGVVGTAVMTACQELSMKLQASGEDSGSDDESQQSTGTEQDSDPWEQASSPAKAARKISKGVFDQDIPAERIGLLTNVMHWGYGTGWGAVYGLVAGSRRGPALRRGVLFGTGVWLMSYVQLVPMGLYQPPWNYPPKDLGMELGYHVAYGAGVAGAYRTLDGST